MTHHKYVLYFVIHLFLNVYGISITNKICIDSFDKDACSQIARGQEFECTQNTASKVDCFLNINRGEPQFAIVDPEEAFLAAAALNTSNITVVGEVKEGVEPFQTVVVVQNPHNGGFRGLLGKSFCHPGFNHDEEVTRFVLEEFENKVLGHFYNATSPFTLLEQKINKLSSFFGDSCRPGDWTQDENLDAQLKRNFSSLCKLCGRELCSVTYQNPFKDSLQCLESQGYVALSTVKESTIFFSKPENHNRFQYLCPNETVTNGSNPCIWTSQLRRIVITGRDTTNVTRNFVTSHISQNNRGLTESVKKALSLSKTSTIDLFKDISLQDYLLANRSFPPIDTNTLSIKWCTVSNEEQNKCHWLRQASLNAGLSPLIECTQAIDHNMCLADVASGSADITFSDADYGYTSVKKGLTSVAYVETLNEHLSSIVVVIKNNSDIQHFGDLHQKSGCFPRYTGKEWLAFMDRLKKEKIMNIGCDWEEQFQQFVGESCAPGATNNNDIIDKLCVCIPAITTIPHKYCGADDNNTFFGSEGAMKCLNNSDYAVVTLNDIKDLSNPIYQNYVILCRNNSRSLFKGLYFDENAALTTITAGRLVIKNDNHKKNDIVLLLREIEREFGYKLGKFFKVFKSFDNQKDLLFPESTTGLTFTGTDIKYVENFKELLNNAEQCSVAPSSASAIQSFAFVIISGLLLLKLYDIIRLY